MRSVVRNHMYALRTAWRRLLQTPFSSLTNIVVIAFSVALPLVAAAVIVSVQPMTQQVSVNPAITLYMKKNVSLEESKSLADQIKKDFTDQVQSVQVVDKNDALKSLKASPSWAQALDTLPNNPLPHAIIITTADQLGNHLGLASQGAQMAKHLSQLPQVDQVQFDTDWLKKIEAIVYFLEVVLGLLALGVAVVVVATVFNTVRMQALVQRDEIAVARLVGATESFVRRPFLYLGAITGLIAGILSIVLTLVALFFVNSLIDELAQDYEHGFSIHLPDAFWLLFSIILTMVVSALAARWSVTRHSNF